MDEEVFNARIKQGRKMERLNDEMPTYGPIEEDDIPLIEAVQGTWSSADRGWNLIALPSNHADATFKYRVLMNQYKEDLLFLAPDRNIPNRGITPDGSGKVDQLIDAVDYQQVISQVAAEDSPKSGQAADDGDGIHHEPGLVLHLLNHRAEHNGKKLKIARLATIPHGDSVLALGTIDKFAGPPTIPDLNALPLRATQDLSKAYLGPYKHFEDKPFKGTVPVPSFPGMFASNANAILQLGIDGLDVKETTVLHFDTQYGTGGIVNIPFVVREANATDMVATFWIMELTSGAFVMMYSQTVFLDFFDSPVEPGKLIRWPHVSINMLEKQ